MDFIYIITGVIIGFIISIIIYDIRSIGNLRIDQSDPSDRPYMFMELRKKTGDISKRKFVILKVRREDFTSRK